MSEVSVQWNLLDTDNKGTVPITRILEVYVFLIEVGIVWVLVSSGYEESCP